MNPFEFVLIIIAMAFGMSIIIKRMEMKHHQSKRRAALEDSASSQENLRLKEEVSELKERIKVLERITVEKENSLERQIEELRDR